MAEGALPPWVVKIYYDCDGMEIEEITGHLVSAQLWPDGRCRVQAFDAEGRLTQSFQASKTYCIKRVRADG